MRLILLCSSLCICFFLSAQTTMEHVVYFDFGKKEPNGSSKQAMEQFIASLSTRKVILVQVLGFADKAGSHNFNQELSHKRAESTHQLLSSVLQPATPFSVKYFGTDSLLTLENEQQAINRRVKIIVHLSPPNDVTAQTSEDKIPLKPFVEDVEEQHFAINLDDTVLIYGKEGTILKIAPGSIKNTKSELMKGQADLVLKEYYEPGDIILAGLNTVSDQGPLQTAGMFYMTIVQQKDTMLPQTLKPVEIRMPKKKKGDGTMNVFTMSYQQSNNNWHYTNTAFNQLNNYWDWPRSSKWGGWLYWNYQYENWSIGATQSENYHIANPLLPNKYNLKRVAKRIKMELIKKDSNTLAVDLHVRYRHFGYLIFDRKTFDTSFLVKYHKAEYQTSTSNINWINCDRFLNMPNNTELYVSTPNCNGATIMVYFKRLNAFMPAYLKGKQYGLPNVPVQEPVIVIAFGKNNNGYYFGKKEYTVVEKGLVNLNVESLSNEDFHKQMKLL